MPERLHLAPQAEVAGEGEVRALDLEVEPGHRRDAAGGDAEIDRAGGAELDRALEHLQALGVDGEPEVEAAAEEADGQARRVLARAERNQVLSGWPTNGTSKPAPRLRFSRLKTPTERFGRPMVKPAVIPVGRDLDVRRVGEAVERDQLAQRLDERQRPGEHEPVEADVDVHLPAGDAPAAGRARTRGSATSRSRMKSSSEQRDRERLVVAAERIGGLDREQQVALVPVRLERAEVLERGPPIEAGAERLREHVAGGEIGEQLRVVDHGVDPLLQRGRGLRDDRAQVPAPSRARRPARPGRASSSPATAAS